MKRYRLKKNNWTIKVLPALCVILVALVAVGYAFPGTDEYDCKSLDKIMHQDFEGKQKSDPELEKEWNKCIVSGYVSKP